MNNHRIPIPDSARCDVLRIVLRSIWIVVALLVTSLHQTADARTQNATASTASTLVDQWNSRPQVIEHHPTWIFTPSKTLSNGKHGLLVVLHGCMQTHTDLKNYGNLDTLAKTRGVVVAVPFVGNQNFGGNLIHCWDYDGARDASGNMADLVKLTEKVKADVALNIDPNQVYLVGLSSGGAIALAVGCKAPQIFAGIGAIAGPSVGSSQFVATSEPPTTNVEDAINKCKSLASSNEAALATQITSIAYGDMDKDGPAEAFDYSNFDQSFDDSHAGQLAVVSIRWSHDNVEVLRRIYGSDALGPNQGVQSGAATQQVASTNGRERISLVVARNVGHAWPAGSGRANTDDGGDWIAQTGVDYPDYVVGWFLANNLRTGASAASLHRADSP